MKPVYSEEARGSFPRANKPQAGPSFKNGDFRQVGRNYSKSMLNPSAQPWDPGPPRISTGDGDLTGSQLLQQRGLAAYGVHDSTRI